MEQHLCAMFYDVVFCSKYYLLTEQQMSIYLIFTYKPLTNLCILHTKSILLSVLELVILVEEWTNPFNRLVNDITDNHYLQLSGE